MRVELNRGTGGCLQFQLEMMVRQAVVGKVSNNRSRARPAQVHAIPIAA